MKSALTALLHLSMLSLTNHPFLFSQPQFQLAIGGTGEDYASSLIQTTDGGYAVAGYTRSFGAGLADMYIIKVNASGLVQWSKTIGGPDYDFANSIIQTFDGGYLVGGQTYSFGAGGGFQDMFVVKLDSSGTLQWSKTVGGTNVDLINCIRQTTDGGYVLAGVTYSFGNGHESIFIVKLDAGGSFQWGRRIGSGGTLYLWSIVQSSDGGYAMTGSAGGPMLILKIEPTGTIQWAKSIQNAPDGGHGFSIVQTGDGGFIAAGGGEFSAGNMYFVKLDANGTIQWIRTVGGTSNDYALSIIQVGDGGYVGAGRTSSFGSGGADIYIVRLDSSGTLQWSKTVGGSQSDWAWSIIQSSDGGLALSGGTDSYGAGASDGFIVKLDENGGSCGTSQMVTSTSGTGGSALDLTLTVTSETPIVTTPVPLISEGGTLTTICSPPGEVFLVSPDDEALVTSDSVAFVWNQSVNDVDLYWVEHATDSSFAGSTIDSTLTDTSTTVTQLQHNQTYWWRARAHNSNGWGEFSEMWSFSVLLTGMEATEKTPTEYALSQNYPNPFNPATDIRYSLPARSHVTLKVYSLLGEEVATLVNGQMEPGIHEATFDATDLASGIYMYRLTAGSFTDMKKLIVIK